MTKLVTPRRTARHLTNTARRSVVPAANVPGRERRGLRRSRCGRSLEIRAQDGKEAGGPFGRGNITDSGISLTSLIEILSRPARNHAAALGTVETGPVTLDELRRGRPPG